MKKQRRKQEEEQELDQMDLKTDAEIHLILYPWLAFGHISPFIQLARKLSAHPNIRITFLTTAATLPRITHLLSDSPAVSVHSIHLPHVDGIPPGIETTADATPAMAELLKLAVDLTQPQVTSLNPGPEETLKKKLPEGFEEMVKGRGIVHTGWVQQQQLLRHRKVGWYVCHAGFSSLIEGIVYGCRLVMLPQRGDQFLNAALFARDLGVGVEVERDEENGRFTKEGVRDAVKKMMGNETVREKERKLKEFLMNKEVQGMFMVNFVKKLSELVHG